MATQIQLRRGTSTEWTTANPVLADGEIGLETNTRAYKIGDGMTAWSALPYRELTGDFATLLLTAGADPSPPDPGNLLLYARSIGGRIFPKWTGPSGLDTPIQPAFFSNGIQILAPGSGTTPSVFGMIAPTAVGTVSHPNFSVGGLRLQTRRLIITSAATANAAAELRSSVFQCYRGDNTGGLDLGGFFVTTRFALSSTTALQRAAVGLWASVSATSTSQSPSALTNCILAGWDSADTNLQIMHNDGSGTCTKIDLGSGFPANTADAVYELVLFAAPNAASVGWRVKRLDVPAEASGTITTDLPPLSTSLAWHAYANNGGTAAAVILELMRMYLETDY